MVARMQAHPDMTAAEIARLLGVSVSAARHARSRYGRYRAGSAGLCVVCDSRPVFVESPQARRWRLCKGCYLKERDRREREERDSARVRQAIRRGRGRR